MPRLDIRTVMLMQTVVTLVCSGALFFLWRGTRQRYAGTGYWLADYLMLVAGAFLIFMRGLIPDVFSIFLANLLNMGALLMMRPALAAFSGTHQGSKADLGAYALYAVSLYYFSIIQPSLPWRNIVINTFMIGISARTIWDLRRGLPGEFREFGRPVANALAGFIAIPVIRLAHQNLILNETDFLSLATFETLAYMCYSVVLVALTFAIFMMVARRLAADREMELEAKLRAEAGMKESEERFQRVFLAAPIAMTLSEINDGRYIAVNDKFCEITDFSREELLGRTSVEIGWITAEARASMIKFFGGGSSIRIPELELCARGGRKVLCSYACERVRIGSHEILLTIAEDITALRKAEDAVQAAQRLESLGTLAGGIAHDFNNMLTGIAGNLSLIRKHSAEKGDITELLAEAETACLSAKNLAHQLLTFASGGKPSKTAVDLNRLVREAVSFSLRGSQVKETLTLPSEPLSAFADREQLFQVIQNICLNAVQAMSGRGTFHVTLTESSVPDGFGLAPGKYSVIRFEDSGGGIPEKIIGRLFEPYFSTKGGGRGMGLAASRSILRRHGGDIAAESIPGRGGVFRVILPVADAKTIAGQPESAPVKSVEGLRILVLEDEEIVYKALSRMLMELGCESEVVQDGGEFLKVWSEARNSGRPFSAAIMDLTIPGGMGGEEAVHLLRKTDPDAKVLASSGYSEIPIMADYRKHGFDGALPKPYRFEDLSEVIGKLF